MATLTRRTETRTWAPVRSFMRMVPQVAAASRVARPIRRKAHINTWANDGAVGSAPPPIADATRGRFAD